MQVYKSFTPIVSVIMTTFNRAGLIERAIRSVINQSVKEWELIIVDDGSTDETFSVADKFISDHDNIRYLKHSNRRTPLTLNAGIAASAGEYITFLDSDDEYKPEHLHLRIDFMKRNPEVDLIHGGVEVIGYPFVKDKNDLTKEIHISECAVGGTFFAKRNLFFELSGFQDLKYSHDSDFFERASAKYKIEKVEWQTYIYYRDTPDSVCSNVE
ncbi:MAG: glycosyltransferase family 2 protein [Ignavibacteriales bacterium]|nr:glycosyltransferase family 2 protein [Ignavibacteriales bacterium]